MEEPKDIGYEPGCLMLFRDLTEEQKELFLTLLSDDYSSNFQVLFNVLEDNELTVELLDLFAGNKLMFPNRKKLYKLLEKVKIYTYVKSKNCSPESIKLLSKQYDKRVSQINAIIERVDYLLSEGKFRDIENRESKEDL